MDDIKDYINIYDIAKQLNVSHTTIYNKLKNKEIFIELKPFIKRIKKVRYIHKNGIDILKKHIVRDSNSKKGIKNSINNQESFKENTLTETLLESLQERINSLEEDKKHLREELDLRNKHIETQAKLIENSQVLLRELKDPKLLVEDKKRKVWWKFWN
jgi:hypothetical protein